MKKYLCWSVLIIIFDQITKWLVEKYLYFSQITIINNIFLLTYVQNRGGAWGVFNDIPVLFLVLIPMIIGLLIFFVYRTKDKLEQVSVSMIIGGALGNYIDRLFRGYVVDFIDFRIWPVFNIADIAVVVGVGLVILSLFINCRERS